MIKRLALFVFILSFSINAFADFRDSVTSEFEKEYDFKSGEVVVSNVNGKIDVRTWDKNVVKVYARIEVRANDRELAEKFMEEVEIVVRKSNDQITIEPDYPKLKDGDSFFGWLIGSRKPEVSVNFLITTPKNVDVDLKSVNGTVDVDDINGSAKLRTVNGSIDANEMGGPVNASTTNGGIKVEITKLSDNQRMDFSTVNGGITVYLPGDIEADIKISTVNGGVHTDFPLEFKGKWGPKNVSGKINGGGETIKLSSVNGGVSLYKK